jgi:hypothetical protein
VKIKNEGGWFIFSAFVSSKQKEEKDLTVCHDLSSFPHHKALESILQSFFVLDCQIKHA